jgi:hypothetical protein
MLYNIEIGIEARGRTLGAGTQNPASQNVKCNGYNDVLNIVTYGPFL